MPAITAHDGAFPSDRASRGVRVAAVQWVSMRGGAACDADADGGAQQGERGAGSGRWVQRERGCSLQSEV